MNLIERFPCLTSSAGFNVSQPSARISDEKKMDSLAVHGGVGVRVHDHPQFCQIHQINSANATARNGLVLPLNHPNPSAGSSRPMRASVSARI